MNYTWEKSNNYHSALYFKAKEIMDISKKISDYLVPDLAKLESNGCEDRNIYFTGDIVQHSHSLVTNIDKAEREYFQDNRMKYVAAVGKLTDKLFKYCETLERANSNGRDFMKILRKELKKFQKLQKVWKLTL